MVRGLVLVLAAIISWACSAVGQEGPFRNVSVLQAGWTFWNVFDLNQLLETQGYPTLPGSCFIWGGQNTIFPPGVFGDWSLKIANWYGTVTAKSDERLTKLTLTWLGGIAEQPLPRIALMRWELQASLAVGAGVANLTVLDHRPASFSEALRSPAAAFFTRWFFTVGPQLSASFPVLTFEKSHALLLTLSAGYTLTFDNGSWDQEGRALKGPPANFNSWIVQLSIGLW